MNQDPLFELTRSPQLNALINRTKDFYSGEITDAEYKESIKALYSFRKQLREVLREQIKFTPMTPSLRRQTDSIEIYLEDIRKSLEEIYSYFNDRNRDHIESGLFKCRASFDKLALAIDEIQKEEASGKEYSKAPLQNELMRIGYAMLEGSVSRDAFKIKLDSMKNSLRMYYGYFGNIVPSGGEREYFEEHREEMRLTVREYIKALEEASLYYRDFNPEHVKSGLSRSHDAAEKLLEFQQKLLELKSVKRCFKCGAENEASSRYCISCSAALPVIADESGETIDFKVDENNSINNTGHVQTELTKKVTDTVDAFKSGAMTLYDASAVISSITDSIAQTRKEKESLQIPQEIQQDSEYAPMFNEVEELMTAGLIDMEEGLRSLLYSMEGNDESGMIFAIERFLGGADSLSKVVMMSQQAQSEQ